MSVGMPGIGKNILHWSALHDAACVHDRNLLAQSRYDTQIMGNEHNRCTNFLTYVFHELQYLGLYGHIQCSGWLVGYEYFRLAGNSHGNHYPLPHPAAKLMRVIVDPLFG